MAVAKNSSTKRVNDMRARRREDGWLHLNDWLPPEQAEKLRQLQATSGKTRAQLLCELIAKA